MEPLSVVYERASAGQARTRLTIRGDGHVERIEGTNLSTPLQDAARADIAKLIAILVEEGVWQQSSPPQASEPGSPEVITISYGDQTVRLVAPPQATETPAFRSLREFIEQIGTRVRR